MKHCTLHCPRPRVALKIASERGGDLREDFVEPALDVPCRRAAFPGEAWFAHSVVVSRLRSRRTVDGALGGILRRNSVRENPVRQHRGRRYCPHCARSGLCAERQGRAVVFGMFMVGLQSLPPGESPGLPSEIPPGPELCLAPIVGCWHGPRLGDKRKR
jgi:hypothetical protein